jgi:hypothetical protein
VSGRGQSAAGVLEALRLHHVTRVCGPQVSIEETSRVLFRQKNIEFALGSSLYVEEARKACSESSPPSIQHHGNFVPDIHP